MGSSTSNLKQSQEDLYVNAKYVFDNHIQKYLDIKGKFQSLQSPSENGSQILRNLYKNMICNHFTLIQSEIVDMTEENFMSSKDKIMTIINNILDDYKISTTEENGSKLDDTKFGELKNKYANLNINYEDYKKLDSNTYSSSVVEMLLYLYSSLETLRIQINKDCKKFESADNSKLWWIFVKFQSWFQLTTKCKNIAEGHRVFEENIIIPLKSDIMEYINNLKHIKSLISKLNTKLDTLTIENLEQSKDTIDIYIGSIKEALP